MGRVYSDGMSRLASAKEQLLAIDHNFSSLVPAVEADEIFLKKRPIMEAYFLQHPLEIFENIMHRAMQVHMPRVEERVKNIENVREAIGPSLLPQSTEVAYFALSAVWATDNWSNTQREVIERAIQLAQYLAEIGGYDLGAATQAYIEGYKSLCYPANFFQDGMDYGHSIEICSKLFRILGVNYWDQLMADIGAAEFYANQLK